MGIDAFALKREDVLFAAFAGWDASGAKLFGYPTFWVNRQKQPREQLDAVPDGEGQGMTDLVHFLSELAPATSCTLYHRRGLCSKNRRQRS